MSRPTFYVTTPIYFVNDVPHIGHMYTTVVADTVARYRRATGFDVRFLTGTDEHGQKIERAAASSGSSRSPWPTASSRATTSCGSSFRSRTTISSGPASRAIAMRCSRSSAACAPPATSTRGRTRGCTAPAARPSTPKARSRTAAASRDIPSSTSPKSSYFFRLSKYAKPLSDWYEAHPGFVRPASRFNEVKAFVAAGLRDLSISRTTIRWGIPWPGDPAHVVYVWIDALTNYISALGYGSSDDALYRRYWPAQVHLIGKDILRFHAVYWPAFLMSAGLPLPECIHAHGWWLKDEAKMSKSLGNVVRPGPLLAAFGPDALRYFLLREMTFGLDGTFSDEQLLDRYNGDLANELGNLTSRIVTLCDGGLAGACPHLPALRKPTTCRRATGACRLARRLRRLRLLDGAAGGMRLAAETNRFLQTHAPWALAKDPESRDRHQAVLRGAAEALLQIAAMAAPVMPRPAPRSPRAWRRRSRTIGRRSAGACSPRRVPSSSARPCSHASTRPPISRRADP